GLHFGYGGVVVGVAEDRKDLLVSQLGRTPRKVPLGPPQKDGAATATPADKPTKFRLAVQDGNFSAYLDGKKAYEQGLPSLPDPGLVLYGPAAELGGVKDLRLDGKPAPLDALDLSSLPDLTGWLADYYDESTTGDDRAWSKQGDEILGRTVPEPSGRK